jgi:hypothetical protein
MRRTDASVIRLTKNHVPGVLGMPSLTRDCYIQPCALQKTGRLTTQDVSKALTLEGKTFVKNVRRYVVNCERPYALLAESVVWWDVLRRLQKLDQLLIIACQPTSGQGYSRKEEILISFAVVFRNCYNQPELEISHMGSPLPR